MGNAAAFAWTTGQFRDFGPAEVADDAADSTGAAVTLTGTMGQTEQPVDYGTMPEFTAASG